MSPEYYWALDEALDMLSATGPEYAGGMSNHGPMAAEAICAMGRGDEVIRWVEGYRRKLESHPALRERITGANWREALGDYRRAADWIAFFDSQLGEAAWRDVLDTWVGRLAPGTIAAATHGVIRTGHAVRGLAITETRERRHELAEGLGYWAARFEKLPEAQAPGPRTLPSQAISSIEIIPPDRRGNFRFLTEALAQLEDFPSFAGTAAMVETAGDPSHFVSDLTGTFAAVYLASAVDIMTTIAFVHCITAPAALRPMIPYLGHDSAQAAMRYAWQAAAALYVTFGRAPRPERMPDQVTENRDELIDRALANGDEHAIKLTEVCLGEYALDPNPMYLAAARHATKAQGTS